MAEHNLTETESHFLIQILGEFSRHRRRLAQDVSEATPMDNPPARNVELMDKLERAAVEAEALASKLAAGLGD